MTDRYFYNVYSPQTVITTYLGINDSIRENCINSIKMLGDKQNYKTNVKADMSTWQIWNETDSAKLILNEIVKEVDTHIVKPVNNSNSRTTIIDAWSAVYKKDDYAVNHCHPTSILSFVYYLQASEDDSPLIFNCLDNFYIRPYTDMLVIFPGTLYHEVPPQKNITERIMIAGNTYFS